MTDLTRNAGEFFGNRLPIERDFPIGEILEDLLMKRRNVHLMPGRDLQHPGLRLNTRATIL